MKNTYKWRANSYKYVYIEDAVYSANTENGYVTKGAFLYNKQTGIKIYGRNSDNTLITSTDKVEESLIASVVKGITDGNIYNDLFNRMKSLVDECGDSDYKNIKFHDVSEYFNIDGEECVKNPPPEPCACYEPVINATAQIEDSGYTGPYLINKGSVINHTDKIVITDLEFHIPRGKDGAGGNGGEMGPQGPQGPEGKHGDVIDNIECTYITGETTSVKLSDNIINYPGYTGYTEHNLLFDFVLQKGERGERGPQGITGKDGYDSKIGYVAASANTINSDESANVTVTSATTRYDEFRQFITDLNFVFDIPKGERGEQGPQGEPAKISGVTIEVFLLNEASEDALPEGRAEFKPVNVEYIGEDGNVSHTEIQYILELKLYLPKGPKGDKGDTGLPGEKGATEYYYINESGFTNDDNSSEDYYGTSYVFKNVYWCSDDSDMPTPIGSFNTTENTIEGTVDVNICLNKDIINGGGIDIEPGYVYTCDTQKQIGRVILEKTEDVNDNEYRINVCINEDDLRGGPLYCEGSGITFTEGDDCTMINSNTESYTVSAITCSTGAPVEALGLWEDDVIPSGTTVQEILEKLLCREVFPASATTPSIILTGGSNLGLFEIGDEITLPEITMTMDDGKFNAGNTQKEQPPVEGVKWSGETITPVIDSGFSGFTPSSGTTSISSVSDVVVDLGVNKIKYEGSAYYTKPSNMPITNLGNETQSTSKVSINDGDYSAIWENGKATNNIITQVTGVYPIFVNLNPSKTSYINSVLSGGIETANFLKLPLTAGSSITFDMITENSIHLIVDFPEFYDGSKIRILNNLFNGVEGFLIYDMSSGKKENDYFVQFTGSYKVSRGIKHDINGNLYNYKRMELTGDPIGANKLKFNFNASLNR